jgi:hypothetical protein
VGRAGSIGKAVKIFTELVEDELIDRNVDANGIRAYTLDPIESIMEHLLALDGKGCAYLNVFLATDFLMEVRNRQLYSQVDGAILERLEELAKLSSSFNFEDWKISSNACLSIGRVWQGEQFGYKKLQELFDYGSYSAIFVIAEHYRDETDTHSIVKRFATQGNGMAASVLERFYPD